MNVNEATAEQLENAFQVDGTRARYLVEHRNRSGSFRSWEEVKQVPGFEDKMVENLQRAGLTIEPERTSRDVASGGSSASKSGRTEPETGRTSPRIGLDINAASAEELESVFQMDGTRAQYLVEARKRVGGFRSWEQLKQEAPSFDDGMVRNLQAAGARIGNA